MSPLHGIIGRDALEGGGSPYGHGSAPDPSPFPKGTRLRLFCGAVDDQGDRETAEELLTKSLHGGGVLEKKGDIVVLDREGSFDRHGGYHVYLYYAELTEDAPNPKNNRKPEHD